jgi:hypothetical protein
MLACACAADARCVVQVGRAVGAGGRDAAAKTGALAAV